jgi:AcrR family transcriptional regulator
MRTSSHSESSLDRTVQGTAQERLLRAGTRLIAEIGIDAVNTNVIARAARVGVGTFYAQFEDKHALHRSAVVGALAGLQAKLAANAPAADAPITEQVEAAVAAFVDFASTSPEQFRVAFATAPRTAAAGRPALGFSTRATERRLRALQAKGELDPDLDPEIAARAFAGAQTAVISWWLDAQERTSRRDVIDTLVRMHPAITGRPT